MSDILGEIFPGARVTDSQLIQELWSGYGTLRRVRLEGADVSSVVVKEVCPPDNAAHPRGWSTDRSHKRKLRSYAVEANWYTSQGKRCDENCRVPECYLAEQSSERSRFLLILEDLDCAGFTERISSPSAEQMKVCLKWLAHFHATFLGQNPDGLWPTGTYWHLETRPDELEAIEDQRLQSAAAAIDQKLSSAKFQTLVHGDAKPANFCFSKDGQRTAAVDFQYVGGGVGVKDVAYFIGSALREDDCERYEDELLNHYFGVLEEVVTGMRPEVNFQELQKEWRDLYYFAWADFHRFLKGWSPGHWKLSQYSDRITKSVLNQIGA